MSNRTYGYRYAETADADVTVIAAAIRRDIKTAVADGLLPAGKYAVRTHRYAGGQSINVTADIPGAWVVCTGERFYNYDDGPVLERCTFCDDFPGRAHENLTEDAAVAKMTLERIHGAYNHDGSDSSVDYFDVRYYGSVMFAGRTL